MVATAVTAELEKLDLGGRIRPGHSVALTAGSLDYRWMLVGMLVAGIGAGLLNGETTKVGMTVIPAERAGMASGVSGTMRFTGIVLGFAALGVILFSRISTAITTSPSRAPITSPDRR